MKNSDTQRFALILDIKKSFHIYKKNKNYDTPRICINTHNEIMINFSVQFLESIKSLYPNFTFNYSKQKNRSYQIRIDAKNNVLTVLKIIKPYIYFNIERFKEIEKKCNEPRKKYTYKSIEPKFNKG